MENNTINAKKLKNMFLAAAKKIEANKEYINELNVFPVPDGDTGTNMTLTIMSAAEEVVSLTEPSMAELAKAISGGSLRGARGNSGVILSQLFRGFTKEIKKEEVLTIPILARAFEHAVETAYRAVMKPKEGTILTVAKAGARRAQELREEKNLKYFCQEVIQSMEEALLRTPDLLPVLKEAGVVDSGGQGLVLILKGAIEALTGKVEEISISTQKQVLTNQKASLAIPADIKFGYCTEFIIMLEKEDTEQIELEFKSYLESIGDSIVVVSDDDIVKVHVHTNDPGLAIQRALTYGALTKIKIDNMREEHNEKLIKDASKISRQEQKKEKRKEVGFISISVGSGMNEILSGLGVDYIIEGGQTMNPSTQDILDAIAKVNADAIFVLPNNKNIILAAEQAKELSKDKKIFVVPSKTIPQGITAIINYIPDKSCEENQEKMIEEMKHVKSGQVTYAVRDTNVDGKTIQKGDIIGIGDTGILAVDTTVEHAAYALIEQLLEEESELISIYYGEEVTVEEAEKLKVRIETIYPELEVEVHMGGQPIYYYIISVE